MAEYTVSMIQIIIQGAVCRSFTVDAKEVILDAQLMISGLFLCDFHEGLEHFLVLLVCLSSGNSCRRIEVHTAECMENDRTDKVPSCADPFDQVP